MSNVVRPPKAKENEKKTTSQKITDFLRKYRTVLIAVFGAVVLAVIVVACGRGYMARPSRPRPPAWRR
jgi:hypothetical protein